MKKYPVYSIGRSLSYLIIATHLTALTILCFFADEIHSGVILVITVFSIAIASCVFEFFHSRTYRLQIDSFQ